MKYNNYVFESDRLGFRRWTDADREPFARLNSNKDVMKFLSKRLNREESDKLMDRIEDHFEEKGYGFWVVEIKESKEFIGMIGFAEVDFQEDFTPATEISWRLDKDYWKKGYAIEGAKACMDYGYEELGFDEIYAFTSKINKPSETVMMRLGMDKIGEFRHPNVDEKSNISNHVLYKIDKADYLEGS